MMKYSLCSFLEKALSGKKHLLKSYACEGLFLYKIRKT